MLGSKLYLTTIKNKLSIFIQTSVAKTSVHKTNFCGFQPKFEYTDEHDVSCDVVLIQPIGELKTIDIKSDNQRLWSIFHIDKILVWNELLDRYHQFTGTDDLSPVFPSGSLKHFIHKKNFNLIIL